MSIINIAQRLGMNSGFLWILINRLFSLIKGFVTSLILIYCLSPQEQGIWYTFGSLGALSVFAELGFTQIVMQFVSQEFAYLSFDNGTIRGTPDQMDKFFSLIKYSMKFYVIIIPCAVVILSATGMIVFKKENFLILTAWFIYSISGGLALIVSLFQSIYTGLDKVASVQKNIFVNNAAVMGITCGLLLLGTGVFSLSLGWIFGSITALTILYSLYSSFWKQVFTHKIHNYYSWRSEIVPLQWKYAIGFAVSYFIYQLYVPVVYKTDGNVLAGQLGLTLTIVALVRTVSDAFFTANLPQLNMFVAKNDEKQVYKLFIRLTLYAIGANVLLRCGIIIFIKLIDEFQIGTRFLDLELAINLVLFNIPIDIIGVLGIYTLLHKDGSLYPLTILTGGIGIFAMFGLYRYYDLNMVFSFLVSVYWILLLPINVIVFILKKKRYLGI